jgi:hypothetical protein
MTIHPFPARPVDRHSHASWCHEECSAYVCGCQTKRSALVVDLRAARQAAEPVSRPCDSEPGDAA